MDLMPRNRNPASGCPVKRKHTSNRGRTPGVIGIKRYEVTKSFSKSIAEKEEGNKFCANGDFDKAIRSYNKAILLAPWDKTREEVNALGIAFANRSAVLFSTNKFNESLKDCKRALDSNLNPSHRHKIFHRMSRIYAELQIPSLGIKAIRAAIENLVETNKNDEATLERYKETESEVIIMEKPYASFLLPEHHQSHCHNCFVPCDLPIPCQSCCLVIFCSEKCRKGTQKAHEVECPMMDPLYDGEIGTAAFLAIRTLFKKSPEEWLEFSESDIGTRESDKFRETVGPVYESLDYRNVYTLVKNTAERKPPQLFHLATIAVYLMRVIQEFGFHYIPQDWSKAKTEKLIQIMGGILFRHLQNFPCNAHVLSAFGTPPEVDRDEITWELKNSEVCKDAKIALGVAVYPTLSLINHSCDPNCARIDLGQTCALRVLYPISRGQEVTCSYGPHYAKSNRLLRREELKASCFIKRIWVGWGGGLDVEILIVPCER
ncbi:unnamed protein product [Notodromas monacha]|uniref:SET domain-containing protein n=1 Tax=Notodromas monacha TaxID=399045 RepID=A0A7R9BYE2_9CRUS|nr:unnamed protein product [Notodromas monacha]CAG0922419.1 unnamed protein product [Notodromas monacha]